MKKKIIFLLIIPLGIFALFYFTSNFFANSFISSNHVLVGNPPANLDAESIEFITSDGLKIKGWYSKVSDTSKVIILLHGYKANRLEMVPKAMLFKELGYDILVYDARGCGESDGEFVSLGYYETEDLIAAIKFVKQLGKKDIAVYGYSQGGATAFLAAENLGGLNCIISECTFDNLENAIDNRFRKYLLFPGYIGTVFMRPAAEEKLGINIDKIQPVKKICKIKIPVFIIGGENDTRTTIENTMSLFEAANYPKELWIAPNSEHENIYSQNPEIYKIKIKDFLNKYF